MAVSLLAGLFFLTGLTVQGQDRRLPPGPRAEIHTTAFQPPPKAGRPADEEIDFLIKTELPGPDVLFQRDSESSLFERIKIMARTRPGAPPAFFPTETPITREQYTGRNWSRTVAFVEPAYVCHNKLLFEQKNLERYGWSLGPITPFVSAGKYYYDLALLPYHYWSEPCQNWECSVGKCIPGDPVPLLWYRERFSWTGLAAQGSVVGLGLWIIP